MISVQVYMYKWIKHIQAYKWIKHTYNMQQGYDFVHHISQPSSSLSFLTHWDRDKMAAISQTTF